MKAGAGRWSRPDPIAGVMTLAHRIVTPSSAVTTPIGQEKRTIIWLSNAPKGKATEIDIIITSPTATVSGWPGKKSMNTALIDKFKLENNETVWAVHRVIDSPKLPATGKGYFLKGKGKEDLKNGSLRAIGFGNEHDGARTIYDCAVEIVFDKNFWNITEDIC